MSTNEQTPTGRLSRLGGYEILEKIGQGGMGAVYRARQTSLDRVVALKVLTPQLSSDAKYTDSFLREAKSAARLNHTNVVSVFDAGAADGFYYYAMEFIEGATLFRWVEEHGALPEKTVLDISLCIANALKYAWDKEHIIHRDVKPENVMMDANGNVKLCDLGLAKNFGETTLMSLSGQIFGTPQYMSPEQVRGEPTIDCRSDIYSLGMTMYLALTAQIPFHGGNAALVMARRLAEQLPDPRQFSPQISERTVRALEKMVAKDVADRYQSWDDALRDLELVASGLSPESATLLAGKSTLARQEPPASPSAAASKSEQTHEEPTTFPPSVPLTRRRKMAVLVAIIGGILIPLTGIALFLYVTRWPNSEIVSDTTPPPPPQVNPVVQQLKETQTFAEANPTEFAEIEKRLEKILKDYPKEGEQLGARRLLEEWKAKHATAEAEEAKRRAEQEAALKAEEERRKEEARLAAEQHEREQKAIEQNQIEEAALSRAESVFVKFRAPFMAALEKRDYDAALQAAQQTQNDRQLKPLNESIGRAEEIANRLKHFWETLPDTLASLKGKVVSAQNTSGTLSAIIKGELEIEVKPEIIMAVSISKLTATEAAALSAAARPDDADTMLDRVWLLFVEGKTNEARKILASRSDWDATSTQRLMTMLWEGATEEGAEKTLAQLRTMASEKRWAETRAKLIFFRDRYGQTKVYDSARSELATIKAQFASTEGILPAASQVAAGHVIQDFRGHTLAVYVAALSGDGKLALSGSGDQTVKLWDVMSGREMRTFQGHTGTVWTVAFSPDDRWVLSGGVDNKVRLWDVATGQEVRTFPGHGEYVRWWDPLESTCRHASLSIL